MARTGFIFDIKRFSINDGPGIRITVFFKGCLLSCKWCHNPESQSLHTQKLYTQSKCIGCGECVKVCPSQALTLTEEGIVSDNDLCHLCGKCADVCPPMAIEMSGKEASVEELVKEIQRERVCMDQSGGGMTVSGGEPLLQHEFLIDLLDRCGELGIHRTVDTTGKASAKVLMKVAERTDLFLYDLKHMDPAKHKEWTGVDNATILKNLRLLAENGHKFHVRIPLIKGVNADKENVTATAEFINSLPGPKPLVNLLPYHHIAQRKYEKLQMPCDLSGMSEPSKAEIAETIAIFAAHCIEAMEGG